MTALELVGSQALFLHTRLIEQALGEAERTALLAEAKMRQAHSFPGDDNAHVGAYERAVADLFTRSPELDVAVVSGELRDGQLVGLTQDFYIRRDSDERASFSAHLDTDRSVELAGRFSTSRLVGSTGRTETFGHKRLSMLGYADRVSLSGSPPQIDIRPLFIGWRLAGRKAARITDDRREVATVQLDQFSKIDGKRSTAGDRAALKKMKEEEVKSAFAEIIGEPFVPKDWGGETSDLSTSRLTMNGVPLTAAFAFKGPAQRGTLQIASMGKNGDQAIRLAHESVDLYVVQHHDAIAAPVKNLLSALARANQRRYMVIDGETTAVILREYGHLSAPGPSSS